MFNTVLRPAFCRLMNPSKSDSIFDRIKTFKDACFELGIKEPDSILPYSINTSDDEEKAINAMRKMMIIARVLNEGWKANFSDEDQKKFYVWYEYDASVSAFRFYGTDFGWTHTRASAGVRLSFKDEKTARYFGEQFIDIANEFLTYNNPELCQKS